MNDFKILTPGEKIKNIRTQFDFKQEDITGGDITRNLVSIVENNKANLTENVAKVLADSINNLCKEREIDFSVTEEYLLESVVSQAKKLADDYIDYINGLPASEIIKIPNKLTEIDVFFKSYDTEEKKCLLYRVIGNKFIESKHYSKSMDYYLKAYESSTDNKSTINILVRLGTCCTYLSKYDEAINYYNLLLDLNNDVEANYVAKFNIGLCKKKLNKYDEALNYLYELKEEFKAIKSNYVAEFEVDNMIGVCLLKLKAFNKSLSVFKDLLKNSKSEKEEIITLTNMADVYKETKDYGNLEKLCSKIKKRIEINANFMNSYEGDLYISLAEDLRCIGDIETSKNLLLKSLECFKTGTSEICLDDVEKAFDRLLSLFINDEDTTNIEYLKNEFFELIQKEMLPRANLTSLKFIRYYTYTKDLDKIDNMIDFLIV